MSRRHTIYIYIYIYIYIWAIFILYARKLFHLSLRLMTFGGRSAHLAYLVHKSGRNSNIHIVYIHIELRYRFNLRLINYQNKMNS